MTQKIRGNVYLDTELKESAIKMFKNYGLSLNIEQIIVHYA